MEFFNNLALGLEAAMSMSNLMYCLIGVFVGTAVGVLPGLGPVATIAMLLPGVSRIAAQEQALTSASSALDATTRGRDVGSRTALDVLYAQQRLFGAELELVQGRADYLLGRLRLALAAGELDEDSLRRRTRGRTSRSLTHRRRRRRWCPPDRTAARPRSSAPSRCPGAGRAQPRSVWAC